MDVKAFLSDPRRRTLAILCALAALCSVWAVVALELRAAEVAPKYPPHVLLPDFAGKLRLATRIHIVSKKSGTLDVVFTPQKSWVLPARGNYPASFDEVRKTLFGLANLETIEPKTARADWLHYVDLDAPPQGAGTLIEVEDDQGHVLASLIVGKSEDIGDPAGATGLFVRQPGEAQSWLAKSLFTPPAALGDWLNKSVVGVDRSRIAEADSGRRRGRPSRSPAPSKPTAISHSRPSRAGARLAIRRRSMRRRAHLPISPSTMCGRQAASTSSMAPRGSSPRPSTD
jgi:hypothetical protein